MQILTESNNNKMIVLLYIISWVIAVLYTLFLQE